MVMRLFFCSQVVMLAPSKKSLVYATANIWGTTTTMFIKNVRNSSGLDVAETETDFSPIWAATPRVLELRVGVSAELYLNSNGADNKICWDIKRRVCHVLFFKMSILNVLVCRCRCRPRTRGGWARHPCWSVNIQFTNGAMAKKKRYSLYIYFKSLFTILQINQQIVFFFRVLLNSVNRCFGTKCFLDTLSTFLVLLKIYSTLTNPTGKLFFLFHSHHLRNPDWCHSCCHADNHDCPDHQIKVRGIFACLYIISMEDVQLELKSTLVWMSDCPFLTLLTPVFS